MALTAASYAQSFPATVNSPASMAISRPAAFDGTLMLTWRNRSSFADYYAVNRIYESRNDGAYQLVGSASTAATSWTRYGIERGVKYEYKIRIEPLRGIGHPTSAYSSVVSAKYGFLTLPSDFTLVEISSNSLKFTWDDKADAESGYRISWTDGWGNGGEEFAGPDAESLAIPGLSADMRYNVSISAFDATGAESSARTFLGASTAPLDLRNLRATVMSNNGVGIVRLTWTNASTNDGIKITASRTENGALRVDEYFLNWESAGPVTYDLTFLTRGVRHSFKVSYQVCIGASVCNFWEPKSWTVSATP